ncbi:Esa1p-associated factor [Lobosporangium transversale]|uniref:Chromatin modification-related protein EAF3 n=1 Tax=Lobosporangium transversale TaxID=64571 RepID=A0A1Y2GPB5_9FUNG|nr:MRG-domain-containing protein [Lobosporangium transversale]KAF9918187.1 Esa1p-associated factor [Lobosporangium transversale]ORZ16012.1 MRG-domain-containing protein [Lobosporangium transversale]|eukprot:XP_021881359.1 MRG-domain-containing protein [Lobosporangium transversale]
MTNKRQMSFEANETVLCFHGPLLYEAKILKTDWRSLDPHGEEGPVYLVHYRGWKQTWDEWVPESRALKWNEANLAKQASLKESYPGKKKTVSKTSGSTESSDRGKKRAKDTSVDKEEDFIKRPEIKVPIPDSLKTQLVDDWENITKNHQLVPLPRTPNVVQILDMYRDSKKDKKTKNDEIFQEVLSGVKTYFDKCLGNMLLYRFERQQYVDIRKKNVGKEDSEIYGGEHLLRLFVQFPMLIAHTEMDQDSINALRENLVDILKWMQKNHKDLLLSEYENASPAYQSIVKS